MPLGRFEISIKQAQEDGFSTPFQARCTLYEGAASHIEIGKIGRTAS